MTPRGPHAAGAMTALLAFAGLAGGPSACLTGRVRSDYDELLRNAAARPVPPARPSSGPDDEALAREARLETILRLALARNPDIQEAQARLGAALERVPAASRLPDLEFNYQLWAAPLDRPWALDQADMHMFGLRQTFPPIGSLDARARVALEDARIALASRQARLLDVTQSVRRAYADYYRVDREYHVHLEHIEIAMQIVELARANYQGGRATQQDLLRLVVDLSHSHHDLAVTEPRRRSAQALLNALMARPPDAPLGPPADLVPRDVETRASELERVLLARRPEVAVAQGAVRRSQAALDAARSRASLPSIMVGADYMLAPMEPAPNFYGLMVSMNLPWLSPGRREELRAAAQDLEAERRALESVENTVGYQLRDALARLGAARDQLAIFDRDLLPQSRQSLDSARAAFSAGRGDALGLLDALRSYFQVRLDRSGAAARLEESLADLERIVGTDLRRPAEPPQRRQP